MNILFFLKPKSEIAFIHKEDTLRQAIEKMEYHKYSSIPMIDKDGKYVGSITEGDLLWGIKNKYNLNLKEAELIPITEIDRRIDYQAVNINAAIEDLVEKAMDQNFVPVIDDQGNFIGIITRKDIIGYCYNKMTKIEK
ncbi:CBS domain-containing protein [Faecalimonas sp.]